MGKGSKKTFFKRRTTNGQAVYKNIYNITSNQENTNKTTISLTNKCLRGCGEKEIFIYTVGGNANENSTLRRRVWEFSF